MLTNMKNNWQITAKEKLVKFKYFIKGNPTHSRVILSLSLFPCKKEHHNIQ